MKQEEKSLLLKDLCARLIYGVKIRIIHHETKGNDPEYIDDVFSTTHYNMIDYDDDNYEFLPYLRPMSSMTEEEKKELLDRLPKYWGFEIDKLGDLYFDIYDASYPDIELLIDIIDWLNVHHFDYRGLIDKGLALEAPDGMYNLEKK